MTRKNEQPTYTDVRGKFKAGNPGRPKGARHKATLAVEALLGGEAEALTRCAVEKALEGDTTALRLCLDRIAPAPKDSAVSFAMPPINDAEDAAQAAASVLEALSKGELTPDEATRVMALLDRYTRIVEISGLEARIAQLEAAR